MTTYTINVASVVIRLAARDRDEASRRAQRVCKERNLRVTLYECPDQGPPVRVGVYFP